MPLYTRGYPGPGAISNALPDPCNIFFGRIELPGDDIRMGIEHGFRFDAPASPNPRNIHIGSYICRALLKRKNIFSDRPFDTLCPTNVMKGNNPVVFHLGKPGIQVCLAAAIAVITVDK